MVASHQIQIAAAGLIQHHIADIAGIKGRILQKAIVLLRLQVKPVKQIRRSEEGIDIGVLLTAFLRGRAGLFAQPEVVNYGCATS
ncbi:hypothetical protein BG55_19160 [Erwinia mallotivora]|uniref:Uncharacterized protein n=1 Tax=Erwinia mallotivora TaxID=69222 RepID=A0A014PTA3_9GAMM|nr:hypothetical protein BG55_19160 [Erwinia mallotivora]